MAENKPDVEDSLNLYHGNCHCGAVKFTLKAPGLGKLVVDECDCSMCFRKGSLQLLHEPGDLVFIRGEDRMKTYTFGTKTIVHRFCPTCGTFILAKELDGTPGQDVVINVKTFENVDQWALPIRHFNGKDQKPIWQPFPFTGPEPTAKFEKSRIYTGSCHCGNISMALKTAGPLPQGHEYIQQCNCSICMRNGTILIYPKEEQVSIVAKEPPSFYKFGREFQEHTFCGICGISVWLKRIPGTGAEEWEPGLPVNLRCFEDVEWDEIDIKKGNWKYEGEPYVVPE